MDLGFVAAAVAENLEAAERAELEAEEERRDLTAAATAAIGEPIRDFERQREWRGLPGFYGRQGLGHPGSRTAHQIWPGPTKGTSTTI